jgi:hypothetical protein
VAHLKTIRDQAGQIVGFGSPDDAPQFAAMMQESMSAVGASPAPAPESAVEQPAPRRTFGRVELAGSVAGLIVALALIALITQVAPALPSGKSILPTATIHSTTPSPAATAQAVAAPASPDVARLASLPRLPRAIVAYGAPGRAVLGPIESGRTYTATARYGLDWVQIEVDGSGLVWTEAQPLGLDLARLHDLTEPTPAPAQSAPALQPAEQSQVEPTRERHEMQAPDRPATPTMIVPHLPPRVKPQQPQNLAPDTSLTNRLELAGWPVLAAGRFIQSMAP